jgi:hypothetical protein
MKRPEREECYKVCERCNKLLRASEFQEKYDSLRSYSYKGDICTKCVIEGRS